MRRQRVIVIGGGFGGLYAARELTRGPVDVTLIDRRNFHLFQPLLYQVATGSLSPADISAPLRSLFRKKKQVRVLLGEVLDIDPAARQIILRDGERFEYDFLIVATGSKTSYFGNDRWRPWAPSLKTVEEATAIRQRILYAFEAAERVADPDLRRAWLTFIIVGGGPTGVELAGALAEIARYSLKGDFRSIRPEEAQILLFDGAPRILTHYPESLSQKAEAALVRLGVRVRTGVRVDAIDSEGVSFQTQDGRRERMAAKTVLWAGGVVATTFGRTLAQRTGAKTDAMGRILVGPDLTIPGHPEIYVIGDLAHATQPDGASLPGVAQVAMQGGAYAARAILARLEGYKELPPFRYHDRGSLAVIGRGQAVASIFGLRISGLPAWLIWLFVHLMYLVEFRSRLVVFIQWGFQYLTFGRSAMLITGKDAPASPLPEAAVKATAED